jgi:beta-glucanase (GH16 family)
MASFWMLGSNIDQVELHVCGEIDILEYVGKEPNIWFYHYTQDHGNTIIQENKIQVQKVFMLRDEDQKKSNFL